MPPLGQASRPPHDLSPLPRPSRGRPCHEPPSGSSRITARTRQHTPYQTGNFECPRARVNVEKLKANILEPRKAEVRRTSTLRSSVNTEEPTYQGDELADALAEKLWRT